MQAGCKLAVEDAGSSILSWPTLASLAQVEEQRIEVPQAVGSTPTGGTLAFYPNW